MIACSLCHGTRLRRYRLTIRQGLTEVRVIEYTEECACAVHSVNLIKRS